MNTKEIKPITLPHIPGLLCRKSYSGHSKGCPNYNNRPSCPPVALRWDKLIKPPIYAIWNIFPFGQHVDKMRTKHPLWSERQARCCLYWQGTARKQLREKVTRFLIDYPNLKILWCPEANWVNVTETMQSIGIKLEWPPVKYAYQIVLAGCPIGGEMNKKQLGESKTQKGGNNMSPVNSKPRNARPAPKEYQTKIEEGYVQKGGSNSPTNAPPQNLRPEPPEEKEMDDFKKELENLINRCCEENESNTPDFILATYLSECLEAFNKATKRRDKWYSVKLCPGCSEFIGESNSCGEKND